MEVEEQVNEILQDDQQEDGSGDQDIDIDVEAENEFDRNLNQALDLGGESANPLQESEDEQMEEA